MVSFYGLLQTGRAIAQVLYCTCLILGEYDNTRKEFFILRILILQYEK